MTLKGFWLRLNHSRNRRQAAFQSDSNYGRPVKLLRSLCVSTLFLAQLAAQTPKTQPLPQPDDRFKTDLLLVVAHPDDETGITGYLAKLLDQHKHVAAVYLTRGEAGHNNMGPERATSLGAVREMELRHSMTKLGVENVWFLDGLDTPSQDVLQSLGRWHHGAALEEVVRIVRLTRPEVIVTWLPAVFIGENHGDHQASGVLATEAFDIAGDPAVFPAELAAPVRINETLLEGLRPWQPKKIYYFSDAQEDEPFKGSGPEISKSEISPVRKVPYSLIAMQCFGFHLTQYRKYIETFSTLDDAGQLAKAKSDWSDPIQLTFGKSNVGGGVTDDVFAGVTPAPIAFVPHRSEVAPLPPGISLELAGPWGFYDVFRRAHGLERLPKATVPEIAIAAGSTLQIPLVLHNNTSSVKEIVLSLAAPDGWTDPTGAGNYSVPAGGDLPVLVAVTSPKTTATTVDDITCRAEVAGQSVGAIEMHVKRRSGGLPQN
jgi:LmbE family N-acetylglucosaminyl deacetylase